MIDIAVNMIARNAADVIRPVLAQVLPHVRRAVVSIDSNSKDDTLAIVQNLQKEYPHLEVSTYRVVNRLTDLVAMRNHQLDRVRESWIWIVDSDEYYPDDVIKGVNEAINGEGTHYDGFAFRSWSPWDSEQGHHASQLAVIPRIFRAKYTIEWRGNFGKERLFENEQLLFRPENKRIKTLPLRYVHLTHIKKDQWRKEVGQERKADDRHLTPLPPEITLIMQQIYGLQHH